MLGFSPAGAVSSVKAIHHRGCQAQASLEPLTESGASSSSIVEVAAPTPAGGGEIGDEGRAGEEQKEGDDTECGECLPGAMRRVRGPTAGEKRIHNLTHIPFREWCTYCVSGRANAGHHKQRREDPEKAIALGIDYGFMGPRDDVLEEEESPDTATVLAMRQKALKAIGCTVAPQKG